MDAVLPQTDTIKKTVVSLNHVKANKLTMTKFQYLSNMSIPIEVSDIIGTLDASLNIF